MRFSDATVDQTFLAADIANGRLAMMAIIGMRVHDVHPASVFFLFFAFFSLVDVRDGRVDRVEKRWRGGSLRGRRCATHYGGDGARCRFQ